MKYLCLKHDFSFIEQSNGWTLPNGDVDHSLFFRDSVHLIEAGNVKLAKFIINSIALTNNIYFSSNSDKRYSYSDTCKNKASISFALALNEADLTPLSPPTHAHKCKHYSNNCTRDLCDICNNYVIIVIAIYVKHMVVTILVLQVNLLVLKLFVNLRVL